MRSIFSSLKDNYHNNVKVQNWLVSNNLAGIMLMLLSCCSYALMYCLINLVGQNMNPMQLLFYRNFFALLLILPLVMRNTGILKAFNQFNWRNFCRGTLGFFTMASITNALTYGVVTDVVALGFLTPIWTCLLAVFFFKERLTKSKLFALIAGFAGCYIIVQPEHRHIDGWILLSLIATLTWALAMILVKFLVKKQSPFVIIFHLAWMTFVFTLPWGINSSTYPNTQEIILMLLMAVLSNLSQYAATKAYQLAEITIVTPFDFSRIIFAALIAYFLLGEVIKQQTSVGALIIFAGGYALVKSSRKLNKHQMN